MSRPRNRPVDNLLTDNKSFIKYSYLLIPLFIILSLLEDLQRKIIPDNNKKFLNIYEYVYLAE